MNVLILEDEQAAAQRLQSLLAGTAPDIVVCGVLERVQDAIGWLSRHPHPDLIISDIQLADGLSFEVFTQVANGVPVIFTTAYDEYTLKAFKLNSVDYLLKPIDKDELRAALNKYQSLRRDDGDMARKMIELMQQVTTGRQRAWKARFLIRQGERLMPVAVGDVAFIRADDKVVFLHARQGQKYIIDESLDELEQVLDPSVFFRLNRTYIAPLDVIEKITTHFNGRLRIALRGAADNEIFVSRARAGAFKEWLGK